MTQNASLTFTSSSNCGKNIVDDTAKITEGASISCHAYACQEPVSTAEILASLVRSLAADLLPEGLVMDSDSTPLTALYRSFLSTTTSMTSPSSLFESHLELMESITLIARRC